MRIARKFHFSSRSSLTRLGLLAARLGRLDVSLRTRLVGLGRVHLRLTADLTCLMPACLETALAALAACEPQHRQQNQCCNDDGNYHSGIHTVLLLLVPSKPYPF